MKQKPDKKWKAFFVSVSNEVFVKTPSLLSKDDVKKNCRFNNKLLTKTSNNKIDKNTKQKEPVWLWVQGETWQKMPDKKSLTKIIFETLTKNGKHFLSGLKLFLLSIWNKKCFPFFVSVSNIIFVTPWLTNLKQTWQKIKIWKILKALETKNAKHFLSVFQVCLRF